MTPECVAGALQDKIRIGREGVKGVLNALREGKVQGCEGG